MLRKILNTIVLLSMLLVACSYNSGEPVSDTNRLPVTLPEESVFRVKGNGAFGDLAVAEMTPAVQLDFVFGKDEDRIYEYTAVTGSIDYNDSMIELSSGATQFGTAYFRSDRVVRYRPGQGAIFRFTGIFDTPADGISQVIGCFGGSENGMFVGYDYTDTDNKFGFELQSYGVRHIHEVTVTAGASGAETIDVELNGTTFNIPVTAGTTAQNAQELAEGSYTGWRAEAIGSTVRFLNDNASPTAGAFSIATQSGTFTGTMTELADGAATTQDWFYQRDWNLDRMDGTGPSGMVLDPTKGNVYQIKFQYLGFGGIELAIENPETGKFVPVHLIKYSNLETRPSVSQPIFSLGAAVSGVTAGADKTIKVGSMGGFIEGKRRLLGSSHATDTSDTIGATTVKTALSIRNNVVHSTADVKRVNLRDIIPTVLAVSPSSSNRATTVRVWKNSTLTDPAWTAPGTYSYASIDTAATARSGGHLVFAEGVSVGQDLETDLREMDIDLHPEEILTVELETNGNAGEYTVGLAWKED